MRRKKPEVVSSLSAVQKTEFRIGAVVFEFGIRLN